MSEIEQRISQLNEQVAAIYETRQHDDLESSGCGTLAGIQQTVLWLLDSEMWMHPLRTVVGLKPKEANDDPR